MNPELMKALLAMRSGMGGMGRLGGMLSPMAQESAGPVGLPAIRGQRGMPFGFAPGGMRQRQRGPMPGANPGGFGSTMASPGRGFAQARPVLGRPAAKPKPAMQQQNTVASALKG